MGRFRKSIVEYFGGWGAPYIVTHCERSNDFLSPNDKIAAAVYCLHGARALARVRPRT